MINMNENIICTENDELFNNYKDLVSDRKVRFKIKDIFKDHWDNFIIKYKNLNIRDVVFKNVNKILMCKSFALGYTEYECPNCHKSLIVPNTCKSRFCSSCGTKYTLDRADTIASKSINCSHRHITFTIHNALWPIFQQDRSLLNLLFDAVASTILSWFYNQNHKENFTPRFHLYFTHFWSRP